MKLIDYIEFQKNEVRNAIEKQDSSIFANLSFKNDIFIITVYCDDLNIEFTLNVSVYNVENSLEVVVKSISQIIKEILKGNYSCKEIKNKDGSISINSFMGDIKLMEVFFEDELVYEYKEPNLIYISEENLEKPLYQILTFKEAAALWEIDDSTLRRRTLPENRLNNDLQYDIDYRKSGNTWLITKESMERVYGKLK